MQNILAIKSTVPGNTGIMLGGLESASETAESFGFEISNHPSGNDLIAGTYSDSDTDFELLSSYSINSTLGYLYEAGVTLYENAKNATITIQHLQVIITSMDDKTISGTFTGDYYLEADPEKAKKVIRNGSFYAPLQVVNL